MKIVVIGGGHGASASLRASLMLTEQVTGVINVADDGGSSGRLAEQLGVLPMGDIRQCLAAMAPPSPVVEAFQYRFEEGPLKGHAMGNLLVAARQRQSGDFVGAVDLLGELMGSRGRVVPPTLERVALACEVEGKRIEGQVAVATVRGPITSLWLEPRDPPAYPGALRAIEEADLMVLGPGSLFTSVLPPLLVPQVRDALSRAKGLKVYVCNLVAPPGETEEFDAVAHLGALEGNLGQGVVDTIVVHEGREPHPVDLAAPPVQVDPGALGDMGVKVHGADLMPKSAAPRHDSERLADVLNELSQGGRS